MKKIFFAGVDNIVVFTAVLLLGLTGVFYIVLGRGAASALTDQMLERQLIMAQSGANSIAAFFDLFGKSLAVLARTPLTQHDLDDFVLNWQDTPIAGVVRSDAHGIIQANANLRGESALGVDISDRDYFIWGQTATNGAVFVSEPIISRAGASKGHFILVIASPVLRNGVFDGVIGSAVLLKDVTKQYLNSLQIVPNSRVYVINNHGEMIVTPFEQLIGVNYFDYLTTKHVLGAAEITRILKERLATPQAGTLTITLPNEQTGVLVPFLVAHAPITYNQNQYWTLSIATPVTESLQYMVPLYLRGIAVLVITFFVVLILAIRLAKYWGFSEGFQFHGTLHHEKDHKITE